MKKIGSAFHKNRIIFCIIAFLIFGVILTGMQWSPATLHYIRPQSGDEVKTLSLDDADVFEGCELDENGMIHSNDGSNYVEFDHLNTSGRTIEVKLGQALEGDFQALLYVSYVSDAPEDVGNQDTVFVYTPAGESSICWEIQDREIDYIRLYINTDYQLDQVIVHSEAPVLCELTTHEQKMADLQKAILYAIAGAVVLTVICFFIDCWRKWSERIPRFFGENRNRIVQTMLFMLGSFAVAFIIGLILARGSGINWTVVFLIAGILGSASWVWLCRDCIKDKPEQLFAGLLFIAGITMILVMPFGHIAWDTDSHYRMALSDSFLRNGYYTQADLSVLNNDRHIRALTANAAETAAKKADMNQIALQFYELIPRDLDMAHMPNGILIAVIRLFGGSFSTIFTFGKAGSLVIYTVVCYYAMKVLKGGKMILGVIAMFPTAVFLASNYSYDYWVICFSLLGIALFVSECQQPDKPITLKKLILMWFVLGIAALPKIIYAVWMIIPFFLPRKKIRHKKLFNGLFIFVLILGILAVAGMIIYTSHTAGDLRGGAGVSPGGQLAYILANKNEFADMFLKFMRQYLSFTGTKGFITDTAYLGTGSQVAFLLVVVLLVLAVFTDKNQYDKEATCWGLRISGICFYLIMAVLIAFTFYLVFTSVGDVTVQGCQRRYLIPLLYPLLAFLGSGRFPNRMNRTWYNGVILSGAAASVFINMYITMVLPYC